MPIKPQNLSPSWSCVWDSHQIKNHHWKHNLASKTTWGNDNELSYKTTIGLQFSNFMWFLLHFVCWGLMKSTLQNSDRSYNHSFKSGMYLRQSVHRCGSVCRATVTGVCDAEVFLNTTTRTLRCGSCRPPRHSDPRRTCPPTCGTAAQSSTSSQSSGHLRLYLQAHSFVKRWHIVNLLGKWVRFSTEVEGIGLSSN